MKQKIISAIKKWPATQLLVLALYVVWVFVYFLWGINYVYLGLVQNPTKENEQLALQIEAAQQELENIPDLVSERAHQLKVAQDTLANEQSQKTSVININELVGDIVEIANECNVRTIPLRTTAPAYQTVGQDLYGYWHINMSVAGDFEDIANFIENVDGKSIATGTAMSFTMTASDDSMAVSENQTYIAPVTGVLNLTVYTRS